jgi:hypothetical protein
VREAAAALERLQAVVDTQAAQARHLAARPAVSLTYYEGNDLAVIAHGQVAAGKESPRGWSGDAVYLRLDAQRLFTYAREPERYGTA